MHPSPFDVPHCFSPQSEKVAPHTEPLLLCDLLAHETLVLNRVVRAVARQHSRNRCPLSGVRCVLGWFSYPCQILVIHADLNVLPQASVIKNQQFNRMRAPC